LSSAIKNALKQNRLKFERKRAEKALQSERRQLLSIFDSIDEIIYVSDPNTYEILYVNSAVEVAFNNKPMGELCYKAFQNRNSPCEFCTNEIILKNNGKPYQWEYHNPILARDFFITDRIIKWPDGRDVRFELAVDITDRKHYEAYRHQIQKMEAIGTLAGGIAHDFNNLLTAILGNIELIRAESPPNRWLYDNLSEAKKACIQARGLVQRFLSFSTSGEPDKKIASIVECLKDASMLSLSGSNVDFEISAPDTLWLVEFDLGQMNQAFNNLIVNAKEAMPEGGVINISAGNVDVDSTTPISGLPLSRGKYVKIAIKDHGVGIPEEYLPKIFDAYFSTKKRGPKKGMGLGLTTVHDIISKHGGYAYAESDKGAGTTLFIYLPASEKETIEKKLGEEKPLVGKGRILVMDDEKLVRNVALQMLAILGYEAAASKDGAEAIEMYKESMKSGEPFDAVILDLTVRGAMGGEKALQELMEINPEIRAIISSAYSEDPVMKDFRKHGFRGAVEKPYELKELSDVLYEVLNGNNDAAG
jgi:signal transduction histidine kinase